MGNHSLEHKPTSSWQNHSKIAQSCRQVAIGVAGLGFASYLYEEVFTMESRAQGDSPSVVRAQSKVQHEGRSVWVVTAYAISGLALFGVLVYFFSTFVTK